MKQCNDCYEKLATSEYSKSPTNRDGLMNTCKGCTSKRARAKRLESLSPAARAAADVLGYVKPAKEDWIIRFGTGREELRRYRVFVWFIERFESSLRAHKHYPAANMLQAFLTSLVDVAPRDVLIDIAVHPLIRAAVLKQRDERARTVGKSLWQYIRENRR